MCLVMVSWCHGTALGTYGPVARPAGQREQAIGERWPVAVAAVALARDTEEDGQAGARIDAFHLVRHELDAVVVSRHEAHELVCVSTLYPETVSCHP